MFAKAFLELDEEEIEQRTNIEIEKRVNTKIREAHAFDKMLTKNDYVVLLNLLKAHRERPLERLGEDKVEDEEEVTEEITTIEEQVETTTQVEETTEEIVEETEYYDEPKVIKVLDDDQSSYIRLQELYESVNL